MTPALRWIRRHAVPLLAALALLFLVLGLWSAADGYARRRDTDRLRRQLPAQEDRARAASARRDSADAGRLVRDTIYRRDTVRLTRTVTAYRDRVRTLPAPETPAETVTVRPYVAALTAADTALRACQQAVRSCEARVAAADSQRVAAIAALTSAHAVDVTRARLDERARAARDVARARTRRTWALGALLVALVVTQRVLTP